MNDWSNLSPQAQIQISAALKLSRSWRRWNLQRSRDWKVIAECFAGADRKLNLEIWRQMDVKHAQG